MSPESAETSRSTSTMNSPATSNCAPVNCEPGMFRSGHDSVKVEVLGATDSVNPTDNHTIKDRVNIGEGTARDREDHTKKESSTFPVANTSAGTETPHNEGDIIMSIDSSNTKTPGLNTFSSPEETESISSLPVIGATSKSFIPKILIVEDSPVTLKLYKKMWTNALSKFSGCAVCIDVATDGDEAVKLVKAGNEYLIITMDLEMQRVGGIEASNLLRMLRVNSCIIACSSHALDEVASDPFRGDILLSTINYFIQKPLTRDDALEIVARYVLPSIIRIPLFMPMSAVTKVFKADTRTTNTNKSVKEASDKEGDDEGANFKDSNSAVVPASVIKGVLGYVLDAKARARS